METKLMAVDVAYSNDTNSSASTRIFIAGDQERYDSFGVMNELRDPVIRATQARSAQDQEDDKEEEEELEKVERTRR